MRAAHGARATLYLCLLVSLGANIASAQATVLGRMVAAWPPVALFLAAELIAHIPAQRGLLSTSRLTATGVLALIAGWASWAHMVALALSAGQPREIAYVAPLTVDGLALVALVSLRELARKPAEVPSVAVVSPPPAPEVPATPPLEDERSLTLAPVLEVVDGRTPDVVPVVVAAVEPSVGPTVAAGKAERQAQVRELHLVGWTKAEMATHLGVSPKTIGRDLDDLGLTDPTTPGAPSSNGHHTPEPVGA